MFAQPSPPPPNKRWPPWTTTARPSPDASCCAWSNYVPKATTPAAGHHAARSPTSTRSEPTTSSPPSAESRLLVVDHDQITVAHEALLRAWPRLNGWIVEERADLLARQELRSATERWATGGRNDADLYRGLRLDSALDLAAGETAYRGQEREFVEAGRQLRDREHAEARRRTRRLRILAAVTSVLAAIAIAIGVIAVVQRNDAQQARTEADEAARQADQAAAVAEQQRLASQHALLTARARDLADDELDLALLLAVEARRRSDGADALDALATVLRAQPAIERFSFLGTAASAGLDVGADGRRGAMLDGERLVRFTLPDLSMEPPVTIAGATGLAMSPTSSQIAVTTLDGVTVVNAATGAIDARLTVPLSANGLGPEGVVWIGPSKLGVRHSGQAERRRHRHRTRQRGRAHTGECERRDGVRRERTSARHRSFASRTDRHRTESKIRIVDAATGELTRLLEIPRGRVTDLSFQPGGDLLAVGTADAGLYVLDTATGADRAQPRHAGGRVGPVQPGRNEAGHSRRCRDGDGDRTDDRDGPAPAGDPSPRAAQRVLHARGRRAGGGR